MQTRYYSSSANCFIELNFGSNSLAFIDYIKFIPSTYKTLSAFSGM